MATARAHSSSQPIRGQAAHLDALVLVLAVRVALVAAGAGLGALAVRLRLVLGVAIAVGLGVRLCLRVVVLPALAGGCVKQRGRAGRGGVHQDVMLRR